MLFVGARSDELRKLVVVIRPKNKVNGRAFSQEVSPAKLSHTADDTDLNWLSFFQSSQTAQVRVKLFL